jgi:acetyl esterase/lipase
MLKTITIICSMFFISLVGTAQESDTLALPNTRLIKNIPYVVNGHQLQNFDLYLPKNVNKPIPVLLWIHGGAWEGGLKKWIDPAFLVNDGYAIASIDYRFSNTAIFPAQVQDCNEAIYFIWKNAGKYNLDRSKFIIGGASAGGHLASLIGLSTNNNVSDFYNGITKSKSIKFKAILDFYGPADLNVVHGKATTMDYDSEGSALTRFLGAATLDRPDIAAKASPVKYIDKQDPPILILHGDADDIVPFWESKQFYSWLKLAGVKSELITLPGAGHAGPAFSSPEIQKKVNAFLNSVLQ